MEAETTVQTSTEGSGNRILGIYNPEAASETQDQAQPEGEENVNGDEQGGQASSTTQGESLGATNEPQPNGQAGATATATENTGTDATNAEEAAQQQQSQPEAWKHADLKEDEVANKMLEAYKAGPEEFSKFLEVVRTDWTKMPDEEVLRFDLKQQYPKLSDKAFETLYAEELEKFNIGSTFSEEQEEVGRAKLQRAADVVRNAQIAAQKQYQVPDRSQPSAEQIAQQQAQQREQEAAFKALEQHVTTNPVYRDFETKRGIVLGEGEDAFNLAADPSIKDIKSDVLEGYGYDFIVRDKDGKEVLDNGKPVYDVEKAMLVRLIAKDPKGYFAKAVAHGRALERKATDAVLRNPGNGGGNAAPSGGGGDRIIGPVNIR